MKRWLFHILCAISLVLCLAMTAWWARSHYRFDFIDYATAVRDDFSNSSYGAYSDNGSLLLACAFRQRNSAPKSTKASFTFDSGDSDKVDLLGDESRQGYQWLGFGYRGTWSGKSSSRRVLVPHWFLVLLFLIAPLRWLIVMRRPRFVRRERVCVNCGYDLRATPDRCPECGAEAKPQLAESC